MKKLSEFYQNNRGEELLTELADEDRRLAVLVRSGLFDTKKLPLLKRAMDKESTSMTPQEKGVLIDLLHRLLGVIDSNPALYTKVRSAVKEELDEAVTKEPPTTLLMRRKAIRQFPDGKKVVLYYIDRLAKFISIPYDDFFALGTGDIPIAEEVQDVNETVMPMLKKIAAAGVPMDVFHMDNMITKVDPVTAKSILNVHDAVNDSNKKKLEGMINKSKANFARVAAFAHGAHVS